MTKDVATSASSQFLNLAAQEDGDLGGRYRGGRGRGRCLGGGGRKRPAVPVSTGLARQQQRPSRRLHLRDTSSSERHLRGTVFVIYTVHVHDNDNDEDIKSSHPIEGFIKSQLNLNICIQS